MNDDDKAGPTGPTSAGQPDASHIPASLVAPEAREIAIQRLSTAFEQDYLSADEFEERLTEVYRAASSNALVAITADLPTTIPGGSAVRAQAMPGKVSSVLSNVERGGSLIVPPELELRSTLGNIELDLRDARFQEGVTEIRVRAIMGNIELILPERLEVECRGRAFVGHFAHRASHLPSDRAVGPDHVVVLTGRSILGSVEVRHAPSTFDLAGPKDSHSSGSTSE